MSLTLNIAVNYGNLSDDNNGSLLLSLVTTPHLEFEWCSDEVCPIERGKCTREIWPVLGWSQSYATVSNCNCFIGFGGEACSDRVESKFVLFVWLVLLCGSMVAGLPSVRLAMRLEPITRIVGVMLMGSMVSSALYHMCDLNIFCVVSYPFLHILDDVFVISAFCSIMFYHMYIPVAGLEHALMTRILLLICIVSTAALGVGDYWIVGFAIFICAVLMLGSWCVEIYYLYTVPENLGCCGAVSKFFLSGNYLNTTKLGIGLFILLCGVISFSLSGKLNYAIAHSIWHICAMGMIFFNPFIYSSLSMCC